MLPHPSQLPGRPLHSDLTPCQLCRGGGPLHSHLRKILSLMPAHTGHHSKFPMVRQCEQEGPSVTSPQWVTSPPFHSGVYLNMVFPVVMYRCASRRGLTPRGSLECNPEIPAFPGEEN